MDPYYDKDDIRIFHRDNIELLSELPSGSVDLIYCDILYNTGKVFDDYSDDLGSPDEATEWYRPRIEQMRRVLSGRGSIFIHCNWRMDSYMRILMDGIFGTNCFRNRIYRKHSNERGFYANFDSQVDVILYYVKDPRNFVFHELHGQTERIVPLFENGVLRERDDVRYVNGTEVDLKALNKHWLVSLAQFNDMMRAGQIQLIDGLPYRFSDIIPVGNLWSEPEMLDEYKRTDVADAYDTPKPEAVLDRIIRIASDPGDLVADFFMGGGTTAVVSKKLGRRFIGCDISEKACEVTVSKLEKFK